MLCRVFCALLFVAWTEETRKLMYEGYWKSPLAILNPLVTSLPGLHLSPWQLLLIALAPVCLLWKGGLQRRSWPMDLAILTSLGSIALTFLWGMARGGSSYNAFFQLGAFLTALLFGILLSSIVRRGSDLRALGLTVLAAALTRGTLVMVFYYGTRGINFDPPLQYMTCHEDSLLFVAALLVVLSWALARRSWTAWIAGGVVGAYLSWAIVLNDRRLAWIELVFSLALAYLLLSGSPLRRKVNRALLWVAPLLLVYVLVGWGRPEAAFAPVQALSSSGSNEDASSLARLEETRNLLYTLAERGNPLLGAGWGIPYELVTSYYAQFGPGWEQYRYMPHNSLLAVAAFGGVAGIFGVWVVVPVAAFLGTRGYRAAKRPVDRAAAMVAVCILPAFAAQCYGDIGLQQVSCTLILSTAMAVAGTVSAWGEASSKRGGTGRVAVERVARREARAASAAPGQSAALGVPAVSGRVRPPATRASSADV